MFASILLQLICLDLNYFWGFVLFTGPNLLSIYILEFVVVDLLAFMASSLKGFSS